MTSPTHLLVDFENLQPTPADIALVRSAGSRLWLFHGPHQKHFTAEHVRAWQPLGERAQFVQSARNGKNALDFHIAFYLGRLHEQHARVGLPTRCVVVTKDTGFDSIIDHMRELGCMVDKAASIKDALAPAGSTHAEHLVEPGALPAVEPVANTAAVKTTTGKIATLRRKVASDDVGRVIDGLRAQSKGRPAKRKALERHIISLLRNEVTVDVSRAVIRELEQRSVLSFDGTRAVYRIPKETNTALSKRV